MQNDEITPPTKVITTKRGYTRTITAKQIEFQCRWCYQVVTAWHYPGPLPFYCETCRQGEVRNAIAANSIRRKRQAVAECSTQRKRPVGRPRQY